MHAAKSELKMKPMDEPERLSLVAGAHQIIHQHCTGQAILLDIKPRDVLSRQLAHEYRSTRNSDSVLKPSRSQWIAQALRNAIEGGKRLRAFEDEEGTLCPACWCALHGIHITTYYRIKKQRENEGRDDFSHGNTGGLRGRTASYNFAKQYLRLEKERFGDYMPHNSLVMMPPFSQKEYYQLYKCFVAHEQSVECVSESSFRSALSEDKDMVFRKRNSAFADCDTCFSLKMKKLKLSRQRITLQSHIDRLTAQKNLHVKFTNMEREQYDMHRVQATKQPATYLSIIIDAMDQFKTNLPAMAKFPKSLANIERIRNRLIGVIVHGQKPCKHLFHIFENVASDTNLTLTILLKTLRRVEDQLAAEGKELPRTLRLQLDNCPAENKNQILLSLVFWLVHIGMFDTVQVCFLVVSHTHTDIDRYFSYVNKAIKMLAADGGIFTLKQFEDLVIKAWTKTTKDRKRPQAQQPAPNMQLRAEDVYRNYEPPMFTHIDRTINFKHWIQPHMHHYWKGTSRPRNFIFHRAPDKVLFRYRMEMAPNPSDLPCPIKGMNPLVSFPDISDLRFAPTRPGMPVPAYRATIDKLKSSHKIDDAEQTEWYNHMNTSSQYDCKDCKANQAAHDSHHLETKPGAGKKRTQQQRDRLAELLQTQTRHLNDEHEAIDFSLLPRAFTKTRSFEREEKKEEEKKVDESIVLYAPENNEFHVGPVAELNSRFTKDIAVGDLVLVKVEAEEEKATVGLARVRRSVADGVMLIHWFGNKFDDVKKRLRPAWTCEYSKRRSTKTVIVYSDQAPRAGSAMANNAQFKLKKASAWEDSISPDSILVGPVNLNQSNGQVQQKFLTDLRRRDDIIL
jgi:hypothetical protein